MIELILLIVGFAILAFLIFKFIKKIVFAVISFILLIVIILGVIGGLIYLDFNYLTSQTDYDVKLLHSTAQDSYNLGINIPIVNQELQIEEVKSIEADTLATFNPKEETDDEGVFVIVVNKEVLEKLIDPEKIYKVPGLEASEIPEVDVEFTGAELQQILDSETPKEALKEILFEKNNLDGLLRSLVEPVVDDYLNKVKTDFGISIKEAIFLFVLQSASEDEEKIIEIVQGYKDGTVEVYPSRFTLRIVRDYVPVSTIREYIPEI